MCELCDLLSIRHGDPEVFVWRTPTQHLTAIYRDGKMRFILRELAPRDKMKP